MSKQSLKIKGQEFVLDAQIKIIKEQTQKLKNNEANFSEKTRAEHGELGIVNRENAKNQGNMEADLRQLNDLADRNE